MKRFKRFSAGAICLVVMASMLLGCGGQSGQNGQNGNSTATNAAETGKTEKTKITILQTGAADKEVFIPEIGVTMASSKVLEDALNAKLNDIEVKVMGIPWDNWIPKTETTIKSGLCDIALYTNQVTVPDLFLDNSQFFEKDSEVNEETIEDIFWPEALHYTKFHALQNPSNTGKMYGLPLSFYTPFMFYDKQIFEDWGVEPISKNATFEEIMEKGKKMTGINPKTGEQNYGVYSSAYWFEWLMIGFNAVKETTIPDMDISKLDKAQYVEYIKDSPEVLKYFKWVEESVKYSPPGSVSKEGAENWMTEDNNIGIMLDLNRVGDYTKSAIADKKDVLERFIPIPIPLSKDGKSYLALNQQYAVTNTSKNPEAAWKVLKTMCTDTDVLNTIYNSGWIGEPYPTRKDVTGLDLMEWPNIKEIKDIRAKANFITDDYWYWRQPASKTLNILVTKEINAEQAREQFYTETAKWVDDVMKQQGK